MQMRNKIVKAIASIALALSMTGCSNGNNDNAKGIVTIRSLTAKTSQVVTKDSNTKNVKRAASGENASSEEVSEDSNTIDNKSQYIVIYRSEENITFTITLDNPEAYGIDAVRLRCDDPTAQIKVDGDYKDIAYESDGTRVVNWASEDAYEKTYDIKLSDDKYLNTLEVVDIRLAGHEKFQSKEVKVTSLGKNELKVYKMADDDLKWNFVTNTREYYEWSFENSTMVSNINVESAEKQENGNYRVKESGLVKWTYDFTYEGVTVKWSDEKEIELLNFEVRKMWYDDSGIAINFNNPISGTGLGDISFAFTDGENTYAARLAPEGYQINLDYNFLQNFNIETDKKLDANKEISLLANGVAVYSGYPVES